MENIVFEDLILELIEIFFSIVNLTMIYYFLDGFFKTRRKTTLSIKISTLVIIFSINYLTMIFSQNILIISNVNIITTFFLSFILFSSKISTSIIASIFSFLAGATSETIATVIIITFQDISMHLILEVSFYRIQARSLTFIIFLILISLVKRFAVGRINSIKIRYLVTLCTLPIFSIIFLQNFFLNIIESLYAPTLYEIFPIIYITTINVLVFAMLENLIKQHEKNQYILMIEAQKNTYINHISNLVDRNDNIQRLSHDFKQQIQLLYILCKEKKYEKLLQNLEELSNSNDHSLVIDTKNLMLDAVLSYKISTAKNKKIQFEKNLDIAPNIEKIDEEICVLIGNALDNAIEACERSELEKFIGLEISVTKVQMLLHITNSVGILPKKINGKFISSKKEKTKHGIGFQSMTRTCEKLNGKLIYEYDEKRFNVWIIIPFIEKNH